MLAIFTATARRLLASLASPPVNEARRDMERILGMWCKSSYKSPYKSNYKKGYKPNYESISIYMNRDKVCKPSFKIVIKL